MTNTLVRIAYVGTRYHGFQVQKNAITVEQVFQDALESIVGFRPDIKGCSRTDSGVHARDYGISFFLPPKLSQNQLREALNNRLPSDIRCLSTEPVPDDFHARYSCVAKRYVYEIFDRRVMDPFLEGRVLHLHTRLDEQLMNHAAQVFLGRHDFKGFSGSKNSCENTVRTIRTIGVERENNHVRFSVEADGFLYNMVRILAGSLIAVSRGRLDEDRIRDIFKTGNRITACETAPACGLYLDRVYYQFEGKNDYKG